MTPLETGLKLMGFGKKNAVLLNPKLSGRHNAKTEVVGLRNEFLLPFLCKFRSKNSRSNKSSDMRT